MKFQLFCRYNESSVWSKVQFVDGSLFVGSLMARQIHDCSVIPRLVVAILYKGWWLLCYTKIGGCPVVPRLAVAMLYQCWWWLPCCTKVDSCHVVPRLVVVAMLFQGWLLPCCNKVDGCHVVRKCDGSQFVRKSDGFHVLYVTMCRDLLFLTGRQMKQYFGHGITTV